MQRDYYDHFNSQPMRDAKNELSEIRLDLNHYFQLFNNPNLEFFPEQP